MSNGKAFAPNAARTIAAFYFFPKLYSVLGCRDIRQSSLLRISMEAQNSPSLSCTVSVHRH